MPESTIPLVGIVMGSDSDLPVMREAAETLQTFEVPFEVRVLSAHRTPQRAQHYAETAHTRGLKVIIAGAGGAAHLAGVLAAHTPLPVLGVPIPSGALNGLDALLATVQMPGGVPVGTLAIGGSRNAALLAVQILATADAALRDRMIRFKEDLAQKVEQKDLAVREQFRT